MTARQDLRSTTLALALLACCGGDDKGGDTSTTDSTTTDGATDTTAATDTATSETSEPADTTGTTPADTTVATDVAGDVWTPVTYTFPTCGAATADLAGCVETTKLQATLAAIDGTRFPGDAKWQAAQDLCATTLSDLGYTVTRQPTLRGQNVIGVKTGANKPDELVIVGAHYDSVRGCDGADDNGSGVAGLLEIARILASGTHTRSLVVACWDVEEEGLIGSRTHAATIDPTKVVAAYVFDMIGFTNDAPNSQTMPLGFEALFPDAAAELSAIGFRGVFIAAIANGDAHGSTAALASAAQAIGLPVIELVVMQSLVGSSALADLHRSDHASFWARGAPAMHITDTANFRNPNYHCPAGNTDKLATLDFAFMRAVTAATLVAAKTMLDAADPGTTSTPYTPACDLLTQQGCDAQRCIFTPDANSGLYRATCAAPAADPSEAGETCTRSGQPGVDSCPGGLYCAFHGGVRTNDDLDAPTFDRYCSPLCRTPSDCAEGSTCIAIGSSFFEPTGICRPRCASPFGGECGTGQKCEPTQRVEGRVFELVCHPLGPLVDGDTCGAFVDCAAGLTCVAEAGTSRCRAFCDADHTCPGGQVCEHSLMADPSSTLGFCRAP